ncbi:BTAD domain-containing putative transcriptional regulator [Streptomyces sp. NPDC127106]|uniref:AfsR/SARP family transcriptional regulator n=1 Tax=Streptomyces sp. NPDC127106 TaxID=3345360 RepID=UPI00362A4414
MDAWVFEDRVAAGSTTGLPAHLAAERLSRALADWGGQPYAEFADESWTPGERTRLEEKRRTAREQLAAAQLRCGRAARDARRRTGADQGTAPAGPPRPPCTPERPVSRRPRWSRSQPRNADRRPIPWCSRRTASWAATRSWPGSPPPPTGPEPAGHRWSSSPAHRERPRAAGRQPAARLPSPQGAARLAPGHRSAEPASA